MKLSRFSIAFILSLVLPVATDIALQHTAKGSIPFPEGEYSDEPGHNAWHITLWQRNNAYYYKTLEFANHQKLCLADGKASGNSERPVFTWNNRGYQYQVAWQPNDPNFIRLTVQNPSGQVILNQLFKREPGEFEDPNATQCN